MLSTESKGLVTVTRIRAQVAQIEKSINIYAMTHQGKLPASLDELFQFASNNNDYSEKPLLKKEDLIDPWGEPFLYERDGRRYVIVSSGPDRKMGTEDDFFEGSSGLFEKIWAAKHTQAIAEQGTNAVQGAAAGAAPPLAGTQKATPNRASVTGSQPLDEPDETESTPWKIPLLIGITAAIGAVSGWRYFRKRGK